MSSLLLKLSANNEFSSWARVVAVWKNGQENGIWGEEGGWEGWVGPLRIMVSIDRYHYDQGKRGIHGVGDK
jgi:hypothetical protein